MFQFQGVWFPDGEKHFPAWMEKHGEIVDGRGTYQIKKLRAALEHCKQFRQAVDVGGHVGLWSMQLAKRFEGVLAFEPVRAFQQCFVQNVTAPNVILRFKALGAKRGNVLMKVDPADTGGTHVAREGGEIENMETLDSHSLDRVDFVKIDCEGYEHHVIEGARETLKRCRPCVIVEQKIHKLGPNFGIKGTPAVDLLVGMGAKVRREMGGDYILSWD